MAESVSIAVALLVRDGLVLLAHRHPSRQWYPDCWDLLGGHVELGESPRDAVIRERGEELGILVRDPWPIPVRCTDPSLSMHAFLVTIWQGEPVNAAPEEHDDLRWFEPCEVPGLKMADQAAVPDILEAVRVAVSRPA